MKLNKLSTSQLHYVESGQFIIRFLTDFNNSILDATLDPEFNSLYESLKFQSPNYDRALMQIKARAESETLLKLDEIRDRKIATIRKAVDVFKFADDQAEKEAYALMMTVLRTYNGLEKMNFEAESLATDNFIAELRNPHYWMAVQTLGLQNHLQVLETANVNFKSLFSTRSSGIISTEVYDTKALRKNILDTYKDLAEYVFVMAKQKKSSYYIDILTILNVGRSYYSDIIARRKGNNIIP